MDSPSTYISLGHMICVQNLKKGLVGKTYAHVVRTSDHRVSLK